MTPVKNGVILYLPQYQQHVRADVYDVGNCWVFVCSQRHERAGAYHATLTVDEHVYERHQRWGYTVYVVEKARVERHHAWEVEL